METTVGISIMEQLLTGTGSPVPFDNVHARIGLGDGNGSVPTVSAADTALKATTNTVFLPMNPGYPQVANGVMVWQGTAGASQGNFAWNEWCIDNGNTGVQVPPQLFNHKGVAMGTKTTGTTWTFQASITQT
jgi:hypothetical protein